jgi:putative sugar O-methyltransferase
MTSVSDIPSYKEAVMFAVESDFGFAMFKNDPRYNAVLEHVTKEQGIEYIKEINRVCPVLWEHIDTFKTNDYIGSPNIVNYGSGSGSSSEHPEKERMGVGSISPTTLRYIKNLADILAYFGSIDGFDVVEIGGGYGGLCKIMTDVVKVNSYTIYDLEPVTCLARKYLSNFQNANSVIKTVAYDPTMESPEKIDLLISHYAFSACFSEVREVYLNKIISKSPRGIMTINFLNQEEVWYVLNKIRALTGKHVQLVNEVPKTGDNNVVIVWK